MFYGSEQLSSSIVWRIMELQSVAKILAHVQF